MGFPWVFHNSCVPTFRLNDLGVIYFSSLSPNKEFYYVTIMVGQRRRGTLELVLEYVYIYTHI